MGNEKLQIRKIGETKVYRLKAKENFQYPAIRLPSDYIYLVGEVCKIFELTNGENRAFLLVFGDGYDILQQLTNQQLQKRIVELESQIKALQQLFFTLMQANNGLNKTKADPAGFEPATYGLEGRRSIHAEPRALDLYASVEV